MRVIFTSCALLREHHDQARAVKNPGVLRHIKLNAALR
jgi:hypothetical protein